MKALKIIGVLLLVLVVLAIGGALYLNHYLQTPQFKEFVLGAARDALGSKVALEDIQISLFSGVTIKGVALANPEGFDGQLLTARAFVLRYRLMPLLHKRVEVDELTLQQPVVTLVRNEKNEWNYEKLSSKKPSAPSAGGAPSTTRGGMEISLSKIVMSDAEIVMKTKDKELLSINKLGLSSGVTMVGNKLSGAGKVSIDTVNAGNSLFVRNVAAPINITPEQVKLAPLTGQIADGALSGDVAVQLAGEFKYVLHLQVKNSDIAKLLQEAGTKPVLNGKLQLTTTLEGTGGLATMAGNGRAEIVGGKVAGVPLLDLLAVVLQVPVLRDLQFSECVMEFAIANNVMQTPVIRLISSQVQITGQGAVSLDDYTLNHNLTIAVAQELLAGVPKEVRGVFTQRPDGFLALDFRVWGPYSSPKHDLDKRLLKGAGEQLLRKFLK